MIIYDLTHGYQPFQPPQLIPDWVEKNLKESFLPVSKALANGVIHRGTQIQGWTIENWLKGPGPIKSLAEETLENLKQAYQKGYIEIGTSGYAHPILPLLDENLIYAQIELDMAVLRKYIGKATWFWFPEGAVSQKSLKVLLERFPELIVIIPDTSLGKKNFSGLVKIKYENGKEQKAIVCNSLLKDIMMNAEYYPEKPPYVPDSVSWSVAQKMVYDGEKFFKILQTLGGNVHVLARDWENKGSKDGLAPIDKEGMDVKGLVELKAEFKLPSDVDWSNAELVKIEDVQPGSWETDAPEDDPFLYWWPNEESDRWKSLSKDKKAWVLRWKNLVNDYNKSFKEKVEAAGGVNELLESEGEKEKLRNSLPTLMSCIPWHFLAKPEWYPDPGFSKLAWENIILPAVQQLQSTVV